MLATSAFAVSVTYYNRSSTEVPKTFRMTFDKATISDSDGDVNDFSQIIDIAYGIIERITIDSNGTDTSYKVYLYDENNVAIFTKTDCSSASEPYNYAVSMSDTGSTEFLGIPVIGSFTVVLADADDATMDDIDITVYYKEYIR